MRRAGVAFVLVVLLPALVMTILVGGVGTASAISPDYDINEGEIFNESKDVINESITAGNNVSEARKDAKQFVDSELTKIELDIMAQHRDMASELRSTINKYDYEGNNPRDNISITAVNDVDYFTPSIDSQPAWDNDTHILVNGSSAELKTIYGGLHDNNFEDCGLLQANRTGRTAQHLCLFEEEDGGLTVNVSVWESAWDTIPEAQGSLYSQIDNYTPTGIIVESPIPSPSASGVQQAYCKQSPYGVGAQATSLSGEDIDMEVVRDGTTVTTDTIPQGDSLTDGYETVAVSPSDVPDCSTASYEIQLSTSNATATTTAIYSVGGTPSELPEEDGNDTVEPLPEVAPPENDTSVSDWGTLTVGDMDTGALLDGRYVRFDAPTGSAIKTDSKLNLSRLRNETLPVNVSISAQGYYPRTVSISDVETDYNVSLKAGDNRIDDETPVWSDYPDLVDAEPIDLSRVIGPVNDSPSGDYNYSLGGFLPGSGGGSSSGIAILGIALLGGLYLVSREVSG